MKIRKLDKAHDVLGYCHDCHNRAAVEIVFGADRPPLRLCLRDARYLIKHLSEKINNRNYSRRD